MKTVVMRPKTTVIELTAHRIVAKAPTRRDGQALPGAFGVIPGKKVRTFPKSASFRTTDVRVRHRNIAPVER